MRHNFSSESGQFCNARSFPALASQILHRIIGETVLVATDAQFHDSIEIPVETDYPFKALRPKRLNEFGIPEKKQYRSEQVASALGISTDLLRWRFRKGKYEEVSKD